MKKANVIILAGQSNAVGVGYTKYLPKYYDNETVATLRAGYENVQIIYASHDIVSDGFVKTGINCTEKCKDTLGPEVGIAKALTERYPEERFFIIKCAFGGVNLYSDWRSPSSGAPYDENVVVDSANIIRDAGPGSPGWCYNVFIKLAKKGFDILKQNGYDPSVIGFCWMQGESDAGLEKETLAYIERYDALLRDIRAEFPGYFENCTFIDAAISDIWAQYTKLNEIKRQYAALHGHGFLDTIAEGLTTRTEPEEEPDLAHYDCGSVVKLGEMFAQKINLKMVKS